MLKPVDAFTEELSERDYSFETEWKILDEAGYTSAIIEKVSNQRWSDAVQWLDTVCGYPHYTWYETSDEAMRDFKFYFTHADDAIMFRLKFA